MISCWLSGLYSSARYLPLASSRTNSTRNWAIGAPPRRAIIAITMRAVEISQPGGPEVLKLTDVPKPAPKPNEILVRVAAAGVNRPDVLQRMGLYPVPPDASPLPGLEIAGEVVGLGAQANMWKRGAKVWALVNGGGYAEYCAVPETQALPVPENVSLVE